MLKPEQAEARLAQWRLPEKQSYVHEQLKHLPDNLRELAEAVFNLTEDDKDPPGGWEEWESRRHKAAIELDLLAEKERRKVFERIAPQLAAAIEATWQLLKTTPYQTGYSRKAFRTPNRCEPSAEKLCDWANHLAALARLYRADVITPQWLATWACHISQGYSPIGIDIGAILAAVLSQNTPEADEVFEILRQSLTNAHEIGGTGRHVYTAFLLSNRREGWELIEKTLLAAQRQEGLRQAILETVDFTHPEAFRRMLRVILDHDLFRFAAVVRAVDVWFGQLWAAASGGVIKKMLTQVVEFLENPAARDKALQGKDAEAAFLALWCVATEDAVASVPLAEKLLSAKSVELRYVAARHLANLDLDVALAALVPAIDDPDLRVAIVALASNGLASLPGLKEDDRFERIEHLVARTPEKPQKLKPIVWPWTESTVERSQVAGCLVMNLGQRPATRLIRYLPLLDTHNRRRAIEQLTAANNWDEATRQTVVDLAGDASTDVRLTALNSLAARALRADEILQLENYLTRKASDLRRGVLILLLKQDDDAAMASARRLVAAKDGNQRLAGLELLRHLADARRQLVECRNQAELYRAARKKLSKEELSHLDEIAREKVAIATLEDALGLMNPAERTGVTPPQNLAVKFITAAAVNCLKSLDDLVHSNREATIKYDTYAGVKEELLGNITWGFPGADYSKPRDQQQQKLPLAEVWKKWFAERDAELKDDDGLELIRAMVWGAFCDEWEIANWNRWANKSPPRQKVLDILSGEQAPSNLRYPRLIREILHWLMFLNPRDARDYLLDAIETSLALVPAADVEQLKSLTPEEIKACSYSYGDESMKDWRNAKPFEVWSEALSQHLNITGQELDAAQQVRHWRLMHWRDEPLQGAPRRRVDAELLLAAYREKGAALADIADHVLAPRGISWRGDEDFGLLASFTQRKPGKEFEAALTDHPEVRSLVDRAVARILELELSRGDAPTAATAPAYSIGSLRGIETLRRILQALGKGEFKLGHSWHAGAMLDRRQTLTALAKVTYPAEGEGGEEFIRLMKAAVKEQQFPENRILQLAFLAPQWTKHIEAYFGWQHLSEGVYWFLAHMRYVWGLTGSVIAGEGDNEPTAGQESDGAAQAESGDDAGTGGEGMATPKKLSVWERLVLERTPLTDVERNEGAIDVAWFRHTHQQLGDKRWQALAAAARFAANTSQANRAKFIADVLLNKIKRSELISGIKKRQLKDHVRLLGLLPLASGKQRDADLMERCRVLREYRRYANQLSGLTKPAALRAWEIGMKNMAQTAGFGDPLRLEWAVGAEAVKDLAKGPVSVSKNGVTVTLSLDELSQPEIAVGKGDKQLKSIPPDIKKDKKVTALTSRVTDLKRQAAAIRRSLEAAMCRGDTFSGDELRQWCDHALLAPLLSRLVVVGEGICGYPDKGGKALRDQRGKLEPVKSKEELRFAHAYDLLGTDCWQDWQRECFQAERVQPFKQVFRELYVVTKQEKKDGAVSHRYDGQQVQPKQALALFGTRGWNTGDGIFKVFHDAGLTASVYFQSGVTTPLDVEGATLAGISFTRQGEWKPIPLADVPPRLFSEVMRDLDLVVSVAHAGGVDPEASASTVEMRSRLLQETCSLLKLRNVRLKPTHALIDGEIANYSIHLGSGVVHKLPGGSLCIVPVHAQHRGRLFLPFADDDPRTAEVLSKVLLLARDREIQDPTILEQIRR